MLNPQWERKLESNNLTNFLQKLSLVVRCQIERRISMVPKRPESETVFHRYELKTIEIFEWWIITEATFENERSVRIQLIWDWWMSHSFSEVISNELGCCGHRTTIDVKQCPSELNPLTNLWTYLKRFGGTTATGMFSNNNISSIRFKDSPGWSCPSLTSDSKTTFPTWK